jgi:hypothetical protein
VGDEDALGARHHPDAGDQAGPDLELRAVGGHGGELEEGRVLVDQQVDPLVGQIPAPGLVALGVLRATPGPGPGLLLVEGGEEGVEGGGILLERRAGRVDTRGQNGAHAAAP